MNATIALSTTGRVLRQLKADPRTIAMILLVPVILMALLYFMFENQVGPPGGPEPFDRIALVLLGVLPFAIMFLITSIAMLRERSSGTVERLLTTPMSKADLLIGYAAAFSTAAMAQAALACVVSFWVLGLQTAGSIGWVLVIAILDAILGVGLGLLCSAFAQTEFQAVQFLPVVVIPQLFLCGLFVPRADLPRWLEVISNVMPLSYAVEALDQVGRYSEPTGTMWRDLLVVLLCTIAALALAAASLRRRTE